MLELTCSCSVKRGAVALLDAKVRPCSDEPCEVEKERLFDALHVQRRDAINAGADVFVAIVLRPKTAKVDLTIGEVLSGDNDVLHRDAELNSINGRSAIGGAACMVFPAYRERTEMERKWSREVGSIPTFLDPRDLIPSNLQCRRLMHALVSTFHLRLPAPPLDGFSHVLGDRRTDHSDQR